MNPLPRLPGEGHGPLMVFPPTKGPTTHPGQDMLQLPAWYSIYTLHTLSEPRAGCCPPLDPQEHSAPSDLMNLPKAEICPLGRSPTGEPRAQQPPPPVRGEREFDSFKVKPLFIKTTQQTFF